MVNIPGHCKGLCALKITNRDGKYVLLFSDGGYAKKSWEEDQIIRRTIMSQKKKLTAIFICAFAIALTACGKTETNYNISDSGSWKDGSYTETAKGKKENFVVTVIISDGKISDIQIGDNKETPDLGGKAIDELPAEMIKRQTYKVDAVSGATITSDGIKDAVAKCLEQASN